MIYYDYTKKYLTDELGARTSSTPSISFMEKPLWELQINDVDLSDIATFRAAIDTDYDHDTAPMCRSLGDDITKDVVNSLLKIQLNAGTVQFQEKLNSSSSKTAIFELWGFNSDSDQILYLSFNVSCKNVIDPDGAEAVDVASGLVDQSYVDSVVCKQLIFEYSSDNENWHSTFIAYTDLYQRVRHGEDGTPSEGVLIPYGLDGRNMIPDAVGTLEERPTTAVAGYCYYDEDNCNFYWYINSSWTEPVRITTITGADGVSISNIEKISTNGLIDTYQITYSNDTTFEYTITNGSTGSKGDKGDTFTFADLTDENKLELRGDDGDGLYIDMSGLFEERHLYDGAIQGFRYLATDLLVDEDTNYKYQCFYQKQSIDLGDWSAGIRLYLGVQGEQGEQGIQGIQGENGENASLVADYEFIADDVFGGSLVISGVKPIAQIELIINDAGDTIVEHKIAIRVCRDENHTILYMENCDYSLGGRVRFAQGIGGVSPYQEWLNEGNTGSYSEWISGFEFHSNFSLLERFSLDTVGNLCFDDKIVQLGDATENPNPEATQYMYYGYVSDLSDITELSDISDLTEKELTTLEKFSVGTGTAGQFLIVLLPVDSEYTVLKFDGTGDTAQFEESVSGANGTSITIDNVEYKLYGEFKLNAVENYIYVISD